MKKLIILVIILLGVGSLQAQFDVNTGTTTNTTITVEKTVHKVFITKKGSKYIKCISPRTKNSYAVWIGNSTKKLYNGTPVRISKKGQHFIIIVSKKTKNPYCKYIVFEHAKD